MEHKGKLPDSIFRNAFKFIEIGNRAVHRAQEENRRLGIPNAYSHRGQIYYELPDGTLTLEDPFKECQSKG